MTDKEKAELLAQFLKACEYTKVDRGYKWVLSQEKLEEIFTPLEPEP